MRYRNTLWRHLGNRALYVPMVQWPLGSMSIGRIGIFNLCNVSFSNWAVLTFVFNCILLAICTMPVYCYNIISIKAVYFFQTTQCSLYVISKGSTYRFISENVIKNLCKLLSKIMRLVLLKLQAGTRLYPLFLAKNCTIEPCHGKTHRKILSKRLCLGLCI